MRLVHSAGELESAIQGARAEALAAFGSDELILEQAILRGRHVEVQVFADAQGNTIHLGERDCSVQRRHQKVIEEAPCPIMTGDLRRRMGEAAVAAAASISYCGAGTVEFLLDEQGDFYFLEMNTRLQVEHPVTEMVTGLDLVALQLRVAQGESLPLTQGEVTLSGHAIEVRLYSEDPAQDFLPTSGRIELWSPPAGTGIRVDDGIRSGQMISPYYDPMLAKIIAHGPNRDVARLRLIEALEQTVLFGPPHNRDFLLACLKQDSFARGAATTAFIEEAFGAGPGHHEPGLPGPGFTEHAAAAVIELALEHTAAHAGSVIVSPELRDWSSASPLVARKRYQHADTLYDFSVSPLRAGREYRVSAGEQSVRIALLELADSTALIEVEGLRHRARYHLAAPGHLFLSLAGSSSEYRDLIRLDGQQNTQAGGGSVSAPMHGLLLAVNVAPGDRVEVGQTLAVLEAMKMHYAITAEATGSVREVLVASGAQVAADELLMEIEVDGVEPPESSGTTPER